MLFMLRAKLVNGSFRNISGGFEKIFAQLLNSIDIKFLSAIAVAFKLQVLDRPLSQEFHSTPPFEEM